MSKVAAAVIAGIACVSFAAAIAAQPPARSPRAMPPSCAVTIRRIQAIIDSPQPCRRDTECALFEAGPILQSVTTSNARRVEPLRNDWSSACGPIVVPQPESSHAACVDHRCARVLERSGRVVYGPLNEDLGL